MDNTAGGKYRRKQSNRSKPYERRQKASLVSRIATSVKSWWSWSSNSEVENVNIGTTSVQNGDRKSIDKDTLQIQKIEDKKEEPVKTIFSTVEKTENEAKKVPQISFSHVEKSQLNKAPEKTEEKSLVKQLWRNKEIDYSQQLSFKKLHSPQFNPMSAALSRSTINGSTVRSPSNVNSSINQESNNSLYYPGSTRYWGANSSMNNLFETSINTSNRYAKLPRVQKVVVTPSKKRKVSFAETHETTTTTPLSSTATKILEAMRQITTPISDVKRIPISDRKSTPYLNRTRRKRHLPNNPIVKSKQRKPPVKNSPMVPTPAKTIRIPQPLNNSIASNTPSITSKSPLGGGKIKTSNTSRNHTSAVKSTPVTENKYDELPKEVAGLPTSDYRLPQHTSTPAVKPKPSSSNNIEKMIESPVTSPVKTDNKLAFSFASPTILTKQPAKDEINKQSIKPQFTFSDPTKPIQKVETSEAETKKLEKKPKRNSYGIPAEICEVNTGSTKIKENKALNAPEASSKPKPAAKWSCPTCMVSNDKSVLKCVCCGENQPGCKPAEEKKLPEKSLFGIGSGSTPITFGPPKTEEKKLPEQLFGFGTGPAKITFGQKSTPEVPASTGKSAFNTSGPISFGNNPPVVAKTTVILPPKPTVQKVKSGKKWECEVCLLQNAVEDSKCVACEAMNPDMVPDPKKKQAEFKYGEKAEELIKSFSTPTPAKSTESSTLTNKPAETEAVKVNEKKPSFAFTTPSTTTGDKKDADFKPPMTDKKNEDKSPTFSFAGPKAVETKPAPTFGFAAGKTQEDKSPPKINFTAPKSTNENKQEVSKPLLNFGAPKEKSTTDVPKFGGFIAKTDDKKVTEPKAQAFSFGLGASKTSETSNSKAASFSFGKPAENTKTENKTAPSAPAFTFGKPSETAKTETKAATGDKPTSLFSFGKPAETSNTENKTEPSGDKPTPSFSFGKPAETSNTENKTEPSVPTFSFGKPAETTKVENKPASGFMFGQKSTPTTTQTTTKPAFGISTEKKPSFGFGGKESSSASQTAKTPSSFSFGDQAKVEQTKKSEAFGGFSVGGLATKTEPAKSSAGFSFGSKPATSQAASATTATGFGSSSGFSFGNKPTETNKPAFGGFGANKVDEKTGFGAGAKTADTSSKPSIFGPSSASTFGATQPKQPENKSIFGASSGQASGSVFGQQNKTAEKPTFAFGKTSENDKKSFSFGSNSNTGFSGGFSQNTTSQKTSMFGENKATSQGSMFQNSSSGGLFGSKKDSTSSNMFNTKPTQQPSTGFAFNSPATNNNAFTSKPQTSSGFNFGANKPKESGGAFNFGGSSNTFGNKTAATPNSGFSFGQNQQQPSAPFSFGASTNQEPNGGGGMFNMGGNPRGGGSSRLVRKAIRRNKR